VPLSSGLEWVPRGKQRFEDNKVGQVDNLTFVEIKRMPGWLRSDLKAQPALLVKMQYRQIPIESCGELFG
jgi:hypothetical protein